MSEMKEIINRSSDRGWSIDNHMLVKSRLEYILKHHWSSVVLKSMQISSSTRLHFNATVTRSMPPAHPGYPWIDKRIEIKGEMILSTAFVWTQSVTPALEMRTDARVYYRKMEEE